jgi:glycosyltransferase involved in cell wall biosynthesis
MRVSCLMPTFNRYPTLGRLVEEAVESFLRQSYPDKELIILNDCPVQQLIFDHPQVRIINAAERYPTLSDKITAMIEASSGDAFCRWDDDDISLPWRLSLSVEKLKGRLEWQPTTYWFDPGKLHLNKGHANGHITSIWTRECLELIGGYPPKMSGWEDQEFDKRLKKLGLYKPEDIPAEEVFYLYRWGTGSQHLSGIGGGPQSLQGFWDKLGSLPQKEGTYTIRPHWAQDHLARAVAALPPR